MFTKLAFVQGVQHSLVESGLLDYADAQEANEHAVKLAGALNVDPTEYDFGANEVAEIADTLVGLKYASATNADDHAIARLNSAADNIKAAMHGPEGLAADGASGGPMDTNAHAGYDVAGNGGTSTPIGAGSSTGSETARPQANSVADRLAPAGAAGAGPDTNAAADYEVGGNGDSSIAERQSTGDELKVATEWGARLHTRIDSAVKVATIRELAKLGSGVERQALVDYVNDTYTPGASKVASDEDILAALAAAAK